jgi:transposase
MVNKKDLLYRSEILEMYLSNKLTKKQVAEMLEISAKQTKRLIKKYKEQGKTSLIHGLNSKPSNNSTNEELKEKILQLAKEKYKDFGPTLLSEQLEKNENIKINHETLRLWLKESKLINKLRKRKKYRTKRERKEYFGEMLQIDGTFHKWFTNEEGNNITIEEKDRKACLINLIDDNSNINIMLFDKQETMICACKVLWLWVQRYGIPKMIYCDGRNMYLSEKDINKEKIELNNEKGYFRTMCNNLNIHVQVANSPQAKGRVERSNGVHQDRLVKLMRLKNITNIEEANKYLREEYTEEHNNRFSLIKILNEKLINKETGLEIVDVHRKLNNNITLNDICYMEETRKVNNDWTVYYKGECYQLKKQSQYYPPTKSTVYVRKDVEGNVSIFYRNIQIEYTILRR